jgi:hypothetical protein
MPPKEYSEVNSFDHRPGRSIQAAGLGYGLLHVTPCADFAGLKERSRLFFTAPVYCAFPLFVHGPFTYVILPNGVLRNRASTNLCGCLAPAQPTATYKSVRTYEIPSVL